MKRFLSLILALTMALSVGVVSFAEDTADSIDTAQATDISPEDLEELLKDVDIPVDEGTTPAPETPETPETPVISPSGKVAKIYLCSSWNNVVPHVFVYVENISDKDIVVGPYICPPGEGVSIGSFGMTVSDGPGVYFNVEAYRCRPGSGKTLGSFMYISRKITSGELAKVTEFINDVFWWDPIVLNCCWFAARCWNVSGGSYILPIVCIPNLLRFQILLKPDVSRNYIEMTVPDKNHVFKKTGTGNDATLKIVTAGSLS